MKYGDRKPRSNCIPSTSSSSLARPRPSSTVITPSLPTFSIALAMISPMLLSELADMLATCIISLRPLQGRARRFNSATTASVALSMPRFKSIGFMPAATYFMPSSTMACASTMAVVVPSPATSEVLAATSRTICAPMFSKRSLSSISLATTTPELMMVGAPYARSSITVASTVMPRTILACASSWKITCLAVICISPCRPFRNYRNGL